MEDPSLVSKVSGVESAEVCNGKSKHTLRPEEKENLQRSTVPGRVEGPDQKPDLELIIGFQSHRQVAIFGALTT